MPKAPVKAKKKVTKLKSVPKLKAKKATPKKVTKRRKVNPVEVLPSTTNSVVLKLWQAKKNEKVDGPKHLEPETWKGKTPTGPNAWDGQFNKFSGPRRRAS